MTQAHNPTNPNLPTDSLPQAIQLAKTGRRREAGAMLRRVVLAQPNHITAWLWLAAMTQEPSEAEAALAQVRRINPAHPSLPQAEQWLVERSIPSAESVADQAENTPAWEPNKASTAPMLEAPAPHQAATLPMPWPQLALARRPAHYLNIGVLALIAVAVVVGLIALSLSRTLPVKAITSIEQPAPDPLQNRPAALDAAWSERDWSQAVAILEQLQQQQPAATAVQEQLGHAYLQKGVALRHKGFVAEALANFKKAVALTPQQVRAQQELKLAKDYLVGIKAYQAGDWAKAIKALEKVQAEDKSYIHLQDLLYSAYFNQGLALKAAKSMLLARRSLEKAITLRPDLAEPRRQLAELEFALAPQTPLATPTAKPSEKLIVVGIAEQRMWVFERGEQVFDFVVSTGEPGRETAIGEFEILDKIDVAYAATWNLDMPYWMGIYWAGPLENGIHSLPIVKHTGYKLWDGYLGQRVSYGCVILSDEDSATLYHWAEVGTKVKIVPSLEYLR
jgi:tetratricopeptide (TPR) repeat protein